MNPNLAVQACRIIPPEKLTDRFILCEALRGPGHVLLVYIIEVTKPWFPSSRLLPSLEETIKENISLLQPGDELADNFEHLLKKINLQLNSISESGETDWIGNLNGLIMVLGGNQLHFSQTGRCPAYLMQKNRIRQITDDPSGDKEAHPLKTFANLSSGTLLEDDYILVANQDLYREVSLDALRRVMQRNSPYQAAHTIVRELKKDKNMGVAAVLLRTHTPNAPVAKEPEAILLEEEMQSAWKRLQKQLAPHLEAAKRLTQRAGQSTLKAAQKTHAVVAPKAKVLLERHLSRSQQLKEQFVKASLPPEAETSELKEEIVAEVAEHKAENIVETPAEAVARPGFRERLQPLLARGRAWLKPAKNRRIVAITAAAVILIGTFVGVYYHRTNSKNPIVTSNSNGKLLSDASDLQKKAATAIQLKQDVEAAREIAQAQQDLTGLQDLSGTQKAQADQIWNALITPADTLSQTVRLGTPTNTSAFPAATNGLVAHLPYFYGFSGSGANLMRARQGVASSAPQALPDATDSIVAMTQPSDATSAAVLLTRKAKVYTVTQADDTTTLQALAPSSGSFATADAIASYVGNIYLLDGKTGLLWKYAASGNGSFAKGVSIIDINKYDLKGGISLSVDGSIYVLKSDGSVQKYTSGVPEDGFGIKNLPPLTKLVNPLAILTDQTMTDFYVLDGGITSSPWSTAKLLEFHKDGSFVRQYGFPTTLTDVRAFDISPRDNKLWVANGGTVNEFALP